MFLASNKVMSYKYKDSIISMESFIYLAFMQLINYNRLKSFH